MGDYIVGGIGIFFLFAIPIGTGIYNDIKRGPRK